MRLLHIDSLLYLFYSKWCKSEKRRLCLHFENLKPANVQKCCLINDLNDRRHVFKHRKNTLWHFPWQLGHISLLNPNPTDSVIQTGRPPTSSSSSSSDLSICRPLSLTRPLLSLSPVVLFTGWMSCHLRGLDPTPRYVCLPPVSLFSFALFTTQYQLLFCEAIALLFFFRLNPSLVGTM